MMRAFGRGVQSTAKTHRRPQSGATLITPSPPRELFHAAGGQARRDQRQSVPLRDLMALGGWRSPLTLTLCYTAPDPATQRQALAKRAMLTADGLTMDTGTDTPATSPTSEAPRPRS